MGPEPPSSRNRKPEWVRILEEDADVDEDVAQLLQGTDGDPEKIRAKMQQKLQQSDMFSQPQGREEPPKIIFREVDNFDLWVWLRFHTHPSQRDRELLQSALQSWFVVGKLGGYNSQNLQVYYGATDDQSYLDYNTDDLDQSMASYMHELGDLEVRGTWVRFHVDMGTADEVALDVLLNMLVGYSKEVAGIRKIFVGGENDLWTVPDKPDAGELPKVSIDPMRLPEGMDDEMELLQQLQALQELEQHKTSLPQSQFNPESMSLYSKEDFRRKSPSKRSKS